MSRYDEKEMTAPRLTLRTRLGAAGEHSLYHHRPGHQSIKTRLRFVLCALVGLPALLYLWVVLLTDKRSQAFISPVLSNATNILWLTAHPDDESMFFAPSILNLLTEHQASNGTVFTPTGHILSLSAGNADGLGAARTVEMRAACWALNIASENCIVLDQQALPDSMHVWWPEDVIRYWTKVYIEKWKIDLIVTFDENGISGHANHRAINAALVKAVNTDLDFPSVFTLRTTRSVLFKYASILSFPYVRLAHRNRLHRPLRTIQWDPDVQPIASQKHAFLSQQPEFPESLVQNGYAHPLSVHPSLLINSPAQYLRSRTGFKQHKSQVVWFRRFYMFLSRYMWFNELEKVVRVHERVVNLGAIREAQKNAL